MSRMTDSPRDPSPKKTIAAKKVAKKRKKTLAEKKSAILEGPQSIYKKRMIINLNTLDLNMFASRGAPKASPMRSPPGKQGSQALISQKTH